jgi:hypothetical protein
VAKKESPLLDAFESVVAASLAAAADERMVGLNLVIDIRKWTKANMITSPAWMLEGRTFAAATGAACGSPQFVTRDIRPPPDDGDGASKRACDAGSARTKARPKA